MLTSQTRWLSSRCGEALKFWGSITDLSLLQSKLEAQYNAKREAHASEVQDLKQQVELKAAEIRGLNSSLEGLRSVNEELKVRPYC